MRTILVASVVAVKPLLMLCTDDLGFVFAFLGRTQLEKVEAVSRFFHKFVGDYFKVYPLRYVNCELVKDEVRLSLDSAPGHWTFGGRSRSADLADLDHWLRYPYVTRLECKRSFDDALVAALLPLRVKFG